MRCAVSMSLAGGLYFPQLLSVLLSSGSARNLWECAGEGSTCPAETQIQDISGFQTLCMVFISVLAQPLSTPGCSSQTFLLSICTTNKLKQIGWGGGGFIDNFLTSFSFSASKIGSDVSILAVKENK